jgi:hypothetical protein
MYNRPKAPPFVMLLVIFMIIFLIHGLIKNVEDKPKELDEEKAIPAVSLKKQPKTDILVVLIEPIRLSVSAKEIVVTEDIYATSVDFSGNTIIIVPARTDLGGKLVIPLSEVQYVRYGN